MLGGKLGADLAARKQSNLGHVVRRTELAVTRTSSRCRQEAHRSWQTTYHAQAHECRRTASDHPSPSRLFVGALLTPVARIKVLATAILVRDRQTEPFAAHFVIVHLRIVDVGRHAQLVRIETPDG